jgi:SAM-dependent methyltransferase
VIAADFDPVMLAMARARFAGNARVTVVEADLKQDGWPAALGVDTIDAALSTTAIHWLPTESVIALYRTLGALIRPGGVFMNGDFMQFLETQGPLAKIADDARNDHFARAEAGGVEPWEHWWDDLATQPAVADLLAERTRRFSGPRPSATGYALHRAALLDAGFGAVDTVWQHFADRVLVASR